MNELDNWTLYDDRDNVVWQNAEYGYPSCG